MFPVLLFLRALNWNLTRDNRTTEIAFWWWELPPTQRTSSIKVCVETAFAVVFISTYWVVCQKRSLYNFFLIKKMVVYQNVVKEFLDLTSDNAMLDRWIPDKYWVQQIGLNRKSDWSYLQKSSLSSRMQRRKKNMQGVSKMWTFRNSSSWCQQTLTRQSLTTEMYL